MPVTIDANHGRLQEVVGPLRKDIAFVTASGTSGSVVSLLSAPTVATVRPANGSALAAAAATISGKTVSLTSLVNAQRYRVEIFQPRSGDKGPVAEGAAASGVIQRWKEIGPGQVTREYIFVRGHTNGSLASAPFETQLQNPQFAMISPASGPILLGQISLVGDQVTWDNSASSGNFLVVVEGGPPVEGVSDPHLNNVMGISANGVVLAAYTEQNGPFKRQVVYIDPSDTNDVTFRTDLVQPVHVSAQVAALQGAALIQVGGPTVTVSGQTVTMANHAATDIVRIAVEGF